MDITATELAKAAEIAVPYAWQLLNGKRKPSREMAYQIYDATGEKFGHIAELNAREIATARRLDGKAA